MAATFPPEGFHTVTPYLIVEGADRMIAFLKEAFGAEEVLRLANEDGTVHHGMIRVGNSNIMLSDRRPEYPPMPCMFFLYVEDADAAYRSALAAGATSLREPRDEDHGDRMGGVLDPLGFQWWVATPLAKAEAA